MAGSRISRAVPQVSSMHDLFLGRFWPSHPFFPETCVQNSKQLGRFQDTNRYHHSQNHYMSGDRSISM
eukprot:879771-Amphidinium_carterae.1